MSVCPRNQKDLIKVPCSYLVSIRIGFPQKMALHAACEQSNVKVVKLLLKRGAKTDVLLEQQEPSGRAEGSLRSALCIAFKAGNVEIVNALLKYGADVNIVDTNGLTPIDCALYRIEQSAHVSTRNSSRWSVFDCLVANKANLNLVNEEGKTPLYLACKKKPTDPDVVKKLLSNGADANLTTAQFYPLLVACDNDDTEIVNLLLSHSADPNVSRDGKTPLLLAARHCNDKAISMLMKHGADVAAVDSLNNTALHLVLKKNPIKVVRIVVRLLGANPDVNAPNSSGETPLYLACESKRVKRKRDQAIAEERWRYKHCCSRERSRWKIVSVDCGSP